MDKTGLRDEFFATYETKSDASVHELVSQYHRVERYTTAHPDLGSHAVATALGLPRSRIRPWIEGDAMPDALRGWQVVTKNGWDDLDGTMHVVLTRAVAGIFAGGSISAQLFKPLWSVSNEQERVHIEGILEEVGVGCTYRDRENPHGSTIEPRKQGVPLGRLLVARGAPSGRETENLVLPTYLFSESQYTAAEAFVRTYLGLRGVDRPDKGIVQILEQNRPTSYYEDLFRLFTRVFGEEAVREAENGVFVDRSVVPWIEE
ncbi:hypothetical protein RH858_08055 [Halalkaliarchaeum sp. AArc-GB]|uniref:hypothetical protein n=1 Tax=Halalkaliarchaeum sp. AArc-GB TaxID=3074078 RepID=UPI00285A11A9|nr:hypothetical protein [Halalkaliarchaeum sp. AArc-GB]MDR5673101.1 hypothetical protein [Halalkaliarchaeum sp. AArc-GB]